MAQSKPSPSGSQGNNENLSKYLEKLEEKDKYILEQLKTNNNKLKSVEGKVQGAKSEIIRTRDAVIDSIKAESERLIEQLDTLLEKNKSCISTFNNQLQSGHEKIQSTIKTIRTKTKNQNPTVTDQILKDRENGDENDEHGIVTLSMPMFICQTDQTTLRIGSVRVDDCTVNMPTPSDAKVIRSFRTEIHASEIRAIGSTQMWCGYFGERSIKLYNIEGQKLNSVTLKFDITGFAINKKGNFIACDRRTESIKEITIDGQVTTLCRTDSLGLCLNHKQQLVVCYLKSLVVFSSDFQTKLHKFTNDQDGKPLFVGPYRVAMNGITYYCVADTKARKVVTIDTDGKLMWTYSGGPGQEGFKPLEVCCDSHMNVIVADAPNNKVHLLTEDGRFIMYIAERLGIENPWGLAVSDDDTLWIGECSDSKWVHVVKYLKHPPRS